MLRYTEKIGEVSSIYEGDTVAEVIALVKEINTYKVPACNIMTFGNDDPESVLRKMEKHLADKRHRDNTKPIAKDLECYYDGCQEKVKYELVVNGEKIHLCGKHCGEWPGYGETRIITQVSK